MKRIFNILALLGCVITLHGCNLFDIDSYKGPQYARVFFSFINESGSDVKIILYNNNEARRELCLHKQTQNSLIAGPDRIDLGDKTFEQAETPWYYAMEQYTHCEVYRWIPDSNSVEERLYKFEKNGETNSDKHFYNPNNWTETSKFNEIWRPEYRVYAYTYTIPEPPAAEE